MISILIPTYKQECYTLVDELHRQAAALGVLFEILVADDASPEPHKTANLQINALEHCRFIELKENLGSGRIRNFLGREAKYPLLLFLDADTMPCDTSFLQRYLDESSKETVLCGGLRYRIKTPAPDRTLRYKYGIHVEEKVCEKGVQSSSAPFISINFCISRALFEQYHFDEAFTGYGHEDTLYGIRLQQNGISFRYIPNPVFHEVADTNRAFLSKTERGIENLAVHYDLFVGYVRLLDTHQRICQLKLDSLLALTFRAGKILMELNLLGKHPSLLLFAYYKLSYLCQLTWDQRRNR
ncbi:MAG: glycosyltransferase [Bacteroidales bacterium]|nr:glycosyltransferase [Bacteroidales bacterium]